MKYKAKYSQNSDVNSNQTAKLDYQAFFAYLKEPGHASKRLSLLLSSVDPRVRIKICDFVGNYLQGPPKDVADRRKKSERFEKMLSQSIKSLRKAVTNLRELSDIELPDARSIVDPSKPLWLKEISSLADVLEREAESLSARLAEIKRLYNEKRFGVSRNHLWLILLQEFVEVWTGSEKGNRKSLRFDDIADLLIAAKIALGWPEASTETYAEDIRKAILNFRLNPTNKWISTEGARAQVNIFCRDLRHALASC
jgi:hypothetical protein